MSDFSVHRVHFTTEMSGIDDQSVRAVRTVLTFVPSVRYHVQNVLPSPCIKDLSENTQFNKKIFTEKPNCYTLLFLDKSDHF